jgi:hypothetical protein
MALFALVRGLERQHASQAAGFVAVTIGTAALIGWGAGLPLLSSWGSGFATRPEAAAEGRAAANNPLTGVKRSRRRQVRHGPYGRLHGSNRRSCSLSLQRRSAACRSTAWGITPRAIDPNWFAAVSSDTSLDFHGKETA